MQRAVKERGQTDNALFMGILHTLTTYSEVYLQFPNVKQITADNDIPRAEAEEWAKVDM